MWGEGTVLAGRYQLRQRIGGGSMGDVWRALDTVLGREVAVKILLPALLDDAGFAARFHTEARVLAALSHPGIVSVFDYGEADDPRTAFLVMELITGRPLSDLLDESAPLSEATTLTVVAQTLEALQAAHDQGIVHRDVKPANLMLRGGSVVVTDFGVARTADARRLTAADVVLGTAVYAAPEQARHTAVTAAADQYAVGVIAYECLTGTPPFDGGTPLGIMMKHLQEPVPPLPETVSEPVRELVMRALAKDPEARFASAREMAETARRLAARGAREAGVTRIGSPRDSFQVGVDVAGVAAAAAAGAAGARVDGDFLSFTVVPRGVGDDDGDGAGDVGGDAGGDEGEGGVGAELSSAGGGGGGVAAGSVGEVAPAWASYAVRPEAEGTDWASFTVSGAGDETVPLPDGEAAVDGGAGGAAAGVAAEASGRTAGARGGAGRVVPQDSFIAGVEVDAGDGAGAVEAAEVGGAARGGLGGRWRKRGQQAAGTPISVDESENQAGDPAEPGEQQTGSPSATAEPQETSPADIPVPEPEPEPAPESEPEPEPESKAEASPHIAPGHAMPLYSFNAGVELDPVDADDATAGSGRVVPQDSFTVLGADGPDAPDSDLPDRPMQPGRRRAIVLAAVGAVVVVGIAVVYPLSHGKSSTAAVVGATQATSSASGAVSTSDVSVTSVVSETSTIVVSSSVTSAAGKPSATASVPGRSSGGAGSPTSTSSAGSSMASRPSATAGGTSTANVPPPPVSASTSAAVPHKSGYITNVGDSDAIDVFGTSAGAPIFGDGAQLTVEPQAGRTGQSFQATALTSGGQAVYEFGDGLDTNQLIDGGGGKVSLLHGGGAPTQMWWLSQDSSTPSGAFYINNQGAGQCLTDNGPSNALSLKPCVAGNKAQQWYLP
ncbi:tRNA A-37 threonylcarbamoyl transferase component Bud32 [Catenulispora sp. GAS73]|uniref:serine/threonine protein kinase n=1 Tax=Catenulispora sp. GAS73 TaxID=3156269 RepID=UPI0035142801